MSADDSVLVRGIVQASPKDLWDLIKDFHDLSWFSPDVAAEKIGSKDGCTVGAERFIFGSIREVLVEFDAEKHVFSYILYEATSEDPNAGLKIPEYATNYRGHVEIHPLHVGDGAENVAVIEWSGSWCVRDDSKREVFKGAVKGIFTSLIGAMQKNFSK